MGYGATRRVDADPNAVTQAQRMRMVPWRHLEPSRHPRPRPRVRVLAGRGEKSSKPETLSRRPAGLRRHRGAGRCEFLA